MELTTKKEEALRGVIGNSAKSVSDTENVAYRNPWVDASLWKEVNIAARENADINAVNKDISAIPSITFSLGLYHHWLPPISTDLRVTGTSDSPFFLCL